MSEMSEKTKIFQEQDVSLKAVKVISVTSPSRIRQVATERGKNPLEVYVKMTIQTEDGRQFPTANTLRVLGKASYEKILKAHAEGTPIDVNLHIYQNRTTGKIESFFYVDDGVAGLDDLFANPIASEDKRSSIEELLA
jgi:hypothetical protein